MTYMYVNGETDDLYQINNEKVKSNSFLSIMLLLYRINMLYDNVGPKTGNHF